MGTLSGPTGWNPHILLSLGLPPFPLRDGPDGSELVGNWVRIGLG